MKKMLFALALTAFVTVAAHSQTTEGGKAKVEAGDTKVKAKPKTTPRQKVHNAVHPKRKESEGTKVKGKEGR